MIDRRTVLAGAAAGALLLPFSRLARAKAAGADLSKIHGEVDKRLDETVKRIQEWIRQPSISAQNVGVSECCDLTKKLLEDAGFQKATRMSTSGHPGVFATLDAKAKKTLGVYFMYDVQPVEEKEWSSPPFEAKVVDKAGVGKVIMGRGAVNQKGPQGAFLAALHAIRAAGQKLPVNLVVVAEGEEELGSPHLFEIVRDKKVTAALKKAGGMVMPGAAQDLDGVVGLSLGNKGIVYLELTAGGKAWGRGPLRNEIHSSLKAVVDSPTWRLVKALSTLVTSDGNEIAVDGLKKGLQPVSDTDKKLLDEVAAKIDDATWKKVYGVDRWVNDLGEREMLERLVSQPSLNIDGLWSGYTGAGVKTILPHTASAKIDIRLVPDMTAERTVAAVKAHLKEYGYADVEVKKHSAYDPTQTSFDSKAVQSLLSVYKDRGVDTYVMPRSAGSWPGYLFTGKPLELPSVGAGLGHGSGAHAKDEYLRVEPEAGKKFEGLAGGVKSFVDYLYAFAAA